MPLALRKIAVIGSGLQATRRAPAIVEDPRYEIGWFVDRQLDRAEKLSKQFGGRAVTQWKDAIQDPEVFAVLVLTYPDSHAEISIAAMEAGKHVLCEKPLCRTEEEAERMVIASRKTGMILNCGFNHRFHPAVKEAYRLFHEGKIGKPVFGRGRYGIAGREGIEKEWRSNPQIVGGGQLMEQGIHLIDLFSLFLGDMKRVTGMAATNKWPITPLEDNGFVLMQTKEGVISSIHSSLTQWINLFEFELYGEKGSLSITGLGASYGVEKLTVSLHDPSGPFSHSTTEYRGGDSSWKAEWQGFTQSIEMSNSDSKPVMPPGGSMDGLRAMRIVKAVYTASETGKTVDLD